MKCAVAEQLTIGDAVVDDFPIWRMISFFAAPQRFETEVFVPRIRMELSDSKTSIAEKRHRSGKVGPAARFHLYCLTRHSICLRISKNAGRRRLASGANRIARGNANRTRCVCIRETDPPSHQPVHVRRANMRVPERSDRIEPLLVGHDKQNVRPGGHLPVKWKSEDRNLTGVSLQGAS